MPPASPSTTTTARTSSTPPSVSIVKQLILPIIIKDLNYLLSNYRKVSFDIWEEKKGWHFYTRMVQAKFLKEAIKKGFSLILIDTIAPLGAKALNQHIQSLNCKKHIILGMMANKDHVKYMSYFKDIETLTTIDIPNQTNTIKGSDLKSRLKNFKNIKYKTSINEAISSIKLEKDDIILITGSLYLAGEVLNLN